MEIKLCSVCKGEGTITNKIGYHNPDYETVDCKTCNGTGRIMTKTFIVEMPSDTDLRDGYYYTDEKIHQLINDFHKTCYDK